MTTNGVELTVVIETASSLAGLVLLWLLLWPQLQIDTFRQGVFAVRDELFLYAASGKIGFDHAAYRLLRKSMNGYIRYGHRLGPFQMLLTVIEWRVLEIKPDLSWFEKWESALKTIPDPEVREALKIFHRRAENLALTTVVSRSAILTGMVFITSIVLVLHGQARGLHQVMRRASKAVMMALMMDPRLIEADAERMAV
jgi:hypothetical protein